MVLLLQVAATAASPSQGALGLSDAEFKARSYSLERIKLLVSGLGFAATAVTVGFGVRQYRRAEHWKRAEFIAREMKDFFSNPRVANALLMIDWGGRRINLHQVPSASAEQLVRVTRQLQCHALLPHTIVNYAVGSDEEERAISTGEDDQPVRSFSRDEAAIRDSYDALLDGLERFASYVSSGLVSTAELRPYLGYWIADIASPAKDKWDAAWNACLLTYIHVYRFSGVQALFKDFELAIDPSSERYAGFLAQMADGELAAQLRNAARSDA